MTERIRSDPIVILGGPALGDGSGSVRAVIHPPRRAGKEGDWYCAIQCPFLFKEPQRVYGETPQRAEEIALSFVKARLDPEKN